MNTEAPPQPGRRTDQTAGSHYRASDRFFTQNGDWYFQTREGAHGPYPSRDVAEVDLTRFVELQQFVARKPGELASGIDWSNVTLSD